MTTQEKVTQDGRKPFGYDKDYKFKNEGAAVKIPMTIKVTEELLADIFVTAVEGGFGTWFPKQRLRHPKFGSYDPKKDFGPKGGLKEDIVVVEQGEDEHWHSFLGRNVVMGGTLTYYEDEDESGIEKDYTAHTLDRNGLIKGLAASLVNPNFSKYIRGAEENGCVDIDIDAWHADYIIQYALLGEVKYG